MTALVAALGLVIGWITWRRCLPVLSEVTKRSLPFAASLSGAALCVGIRWWTTDEPAAAVLALHLVAMLLPAVTMDALTGRLPRRQVLVSYPTTVAAVAAVAVIWPGTGSLLGAAFGATAVWTFFVMLALFGQLGAGDVRLAPVLGAHLGYWGLGVVVAGIAGAFLLGALAAITLAASHKLRADRRIPFGPALLTASVAALLIPT